MIAALDVGGSSIKAGLVEGTRVQGGVSVTDVDHTAPLDTLIGQFASAIDSLAPTTEIAIAMPGPFDHAAGVSLMEHKFVALHGIDLTSAIATRLARTSEIRFCNDAAAAVVGEAVAGTGSRYRRVLGITLGTGLGAAFAVDGQLVAEEAGIVVGDAHEMPMPSGARSDDVISARAYLERLARCDDEDAESIRFGRDVASFVGPFATALRADVVVVGGGGVASFDRFGPALRDELDLPVEVMSLGRAAPLIGAVHICFA